MLIRIEATVNPTEDPQKVLRALRKLFDAEFELEETGEGWAVWRAECNDFSCLAPLKREIVKRGLDRTFRDLLRRLARGSGNMLIFKLNKQAAFVGVPSFAEEDVESPLGPITVVVEGNEREDVLALIDWLTNP